MIRDGGGQPVYSSNAESMSWRHARGTSSPYYLSKLGYRNNMPISSGKLLHGRKALDLGEYMTLIVNAMVT